MEAGHIIPGVRQLRDCTGLPVTCSSEEALRYFNRALIAYVSQRSTPISDISTACELDPSLTLGHCFLGNYWLYDGKSPAEESVSSNVKLVRSCKQFLTERERSHARAFLANAGGNLRKAVDEWSGILLRHPHDLLAMHWIFQFGMLLGAFEMEMETFDCILPHWKESMPLYPVILANYAFLLEQNNQRDRAEELARKSLSLEPHTPEAYHALSHVIEEERDPEKGVELLEPTKGFWEDSLIGVHIRWHLALHHLDTGNMEATVRELDTFLQQSALSIQDVVDAVSLLWRLQLLGIDPGEQKWEIIANSFTTDLIDNHSSTFVDAHIMMYLVHGKVTQSTARLALANEMLRSVQEHSEGSPSPGCKFPESLGVPVCTALLAFGKEQYGEVLSILLPLRSSLIHVGGSRSQCQVFHLTMIEAALRDGNITVALKLVTELQAQKPTSRRLTKLLEELKSGSHQLSLSNATSVYSQRNPL